MRLVGLFEIQMIYSHVTSISCRSFPNLIRNLLEKQVFSSILDPPFAITLSQVEPLEANLEQSACSSDCMIKLLT